MKRYIIIPYILTMIMAVLILGLPNLSSAEDIPDASGFMDLKTSFQFVSSQVKKSRKSIVLVITYNSAGVARTGSGMFIDNEGRIVINADVLNSSYSAEVFSESNWYKKVTVLGRNDSMDIALIQVDAVNETPVELEYEYEIKLGERVIVIGRGADYNITVSEGLISNVQKIGEVSDFIEIDSTAGLSSYRYSEEGTVLNMNGKVIGIVAKGMSKYTDEPLFLEYYGEKLHAISTSSIAPLVAGSHKIKQLHPPGTKIWLHWFRSEIKESVRATFLTLYKMGFSKIMNMMVKLLLLAALVMWILHKFKVIKIYK